MFNLEVRKGLPAAQRIENYSVENSSEELLALSEKMNELLFPVHLNSSQSQLHISM